MRPSDRPTPLLAPRQFTVRRRAQGSLAVATPTQRSAAAGLISLCGIALCLASAVVGCRDDSGPGTDGTAADPNDASVEDGVTPVDAADGAVSDDSGAADGSWLDATDGADRPACAADSDCPAASSSCRPNRCTRAGTCVSVALDVGACDDGNPCTANDICKAGECVGGANACECAADGDCLKYDDGDACNGTLYCDTATSPATCRVVSASKVTCPLTDDQCSTQQCEPASGACVAIPAVTGKPCNDGDPCTVESDCQGGACVAGSASWCQCDKSADCAAFDDDNLCNGTLYCDKTVFPYLCALAPASVVVCPPLGDGTCAVHVCNPADGQCADQPLADGLACDDGDPCTTGDACDTGTCAGGTDTCACGDDTDCEAQEDGDLCNGVLFCNKQTAKCELNPKTVITCPSAGDSACTKNTCNPITGTCALTALKNGSICDDADGCTSGDICLQGSCSPGKNTCLCGDDSDCVAKDDGDLCNGVLFCNLASGACELNPASVVTCPTVGDTACAKAVCLPAAGTCALAARVNVTQTCSGSAGEAPKCTWQLKAKGEAGDPGPFACDDADPCTQGDTCASDSCQSGSFTCTCQSDSDCLAEDDGDLCNGVPFCDKSANPPTCKPNPATIVTCPTVDNTDCLVNSCTAKTGLCALAPVVNGSVCEDGNDCTKGDVCIYGKCETGANVCECQNHADCLAKDDGDLCNGVPFCDKSGPLPKCVPNPASVVFCAKGQDTACQKNLCDPGLGLCKVQPVAEGEPCDDGSLCTDASACEQGDCSGEAKDCDDGDACTSDSCEAKKGCVQPPSGQCDDGNACTQDACDPKTGQCAFDQAAQTGKPCDADDSGCTVNDACDAGTCVAGSLITCAVPAKPCEHAICLGKGAVAFECVVVAKAEGAVCEDDAPCTLGAHCAAGQCVAGKTEKLFQHSQSATIDGKAASGRWHAARNDADLVTRTHAMPSRQHVLLTPPRSLCLKLITPNSPRTKRLQRR